MKSHPPSAEGMECKVNCTKPINVKTCLRSIPKMVFVLGDVSFGVNLERLQNSLAAWKMTRPWCGWHVNIQINNSCWGSKDSEILHACSQAVPLLVRGLDYFSQTAVTLEHAVRESADLCSGWTCVACLISPQCIMHRGESPTRKTPSCSAMISQAV